MEYKLQIDYFKGQQAFNDFIQVCNVYLNKHNNQIKTRFIELNNFTQ